MFVCMQLSNRSSFLKNNFIQNVIYERELQCEELGNFKCGLPFEIKGYLGLSKKWHFFRKLWEKIYNLEGKFWVSWDFHKSVEKVLKLFYLFPHPKMTMTKKYVLIFLLVVDETIFDETTRPVKMNVSKTFDY